MPFAPYEAARSCRSAGPGATNLMYWIDKESPWAKTMGNFGVYNCRLPSIHAESRAGDSSVPVVPGGHRAGHELVDFLTECGLKLGVIETIFARSRRSAAHPNGKRYTGPSPHYDHVHWALSRNAARYLNVPTIRAVYAAYAGKPTTITPPPPPRPQEDIMATKAELKQIVEEVVGENHAITRQWIKEEVKRQTEALTKEIRES